MHKEVRVRPGWLAWDNAVSSARFGRYLGMRILWAVRWQFRDMVRTDERGAQNNCPLNYVCTLPQSGKPGVDARLLLDLTL
jgi:hypothetical protein